MADAETERDTIGRCGVPERNDVQTKPKAPTVVIIEGEIAAGKSELVGALAAALRKRGRRVAVVPEPSALWSEIGILQNFYDDRERWAYSFQTFVYATRLQAIRRSVEENPDAEVFVLERSPATDKIFMHLQRDVVSAAEMKMYHMWCDTYDCLLGSDLIRTAKVAYLRTSLGSCRSRLVGRHRGGEVEHQNSEGSVCGVSDAYQAELRRAHEAFFLGQHKGEGYPEGPFAADAVVEVPPDLADKDYRLGSPGGEDTVDSIISLLGIS